MDERRDIRASDKDRETAVERLRAAHDEGRLSLFEYDERLARAYQAVTYGDLEKLFADLPLSAFGQAERQAARPVRVPRPSAGFIAGLPTWLRVLWGIWLTIVVINLVIWTLVSLSNAEPVYFWPMWPAGTLGAALLGLSVAATAVRRGREERRLGDRQAAPHRHSTGE
ncbi:MAG TPA: DUF1707 domain-containing protein [Pseudonocardiaceae bacterium]